MAETNDKTREKIAEMIRQFVSSHSTNQKENEFLEAVKTSSDSGGMNLPLLLLLMSQKGGSGSMDKFMDVIATTKAIEMMNNIGNPRSDMDSLKTYIDAKLSSLSPKKELDADDIIRLVSETIDRKLASIVPKNSEDTNSLILKTLLEKALTDKGSDTNIFDIIKVVGELTKGKESPLDMMQVIKMMNDMNEKRFAQKEEQEQKINEITQQWEDRFINFIKENKDNKGVLEELKASATTINGIKEFAQQNLGLKDYSNIQSSGGQEQPQWKMIIDAINGTLGTFLPIFTSQRKPPKNPNLIDIDAEAKRLHDKYKDKIDEEISIEQYKQELSRNPNLEQELDSVLASKQQTQESKPVQQPEENKPAQDNVVTLENTKQESTKQESKKQKLEEPIGNIQIGGNGAQ